MKIFRDKLALPWNEGPETSGKAHIQSERKDQYMKFAKSLIEVTFVLNLIRTKMPTTVFAALLD